MAATVNQLNVLASDNAFRERVRNIVLQFAATVYAENPATFPKHAARLAFAVKLVTTPDLAANLAPLLVTRTNLVASNVSYDFDRRATVTDATDAALLAQISTDWEFFAGA